MTDREEGAGGRVRSLRPSPQRWVLVIALGFAAAQLVLVGLDRAPSWDEAIYLSQVAPGAAPMNFAASRARGITFLVATPLRAGASLDGVRLVLTAASAAALAGAFLPWVRLVGGAACVAAAAFGSAWVTVFYGSEVMPNLWVALAGVAGIGFVARRTVGSGARHHVAAAAALFAAAALLRPFDAAILGAIAVAIVLVAGRARVATVAAVAGGLAVGALPWIVEVATRFGGIGAAFDQSTGVGRLAPRSPIDAAVQYLATADGPPIGPVADPAISVATIAALVAAIGVAAFGLARCRGRPEAPVLAAMLVGAAASVAIYLTFVGAIAPRFLTPALALFSIPMGRGLVEAWRGARAVPARAVVAASSAGWLIWQAAIAAGAAADARATRARFERVGVAIGAVANDARPCAVVAAFGYPQIAYPSGCRGRPFPRSGSLDEALDVERRRGARTVFVVVDAPLGPTDATLTEVRAPSEAGMRVYRIQVSG